MNLRLFILVGGILMYTAAGFAKDDHDDHDDLAHDPTPATKSQEKDDHDDHDDHGHDDHAGHTDEVKLTAEAVRANGITIAKVSKQALRPSFVVPARVAYDAEAMAHVGSPVQGRASKIDVRVGDLVKKGDPLLIIESPELGEAQSDYIQKHTAAAVAAAGVEPAKNAYARAKALYDESQGIAFNELQRREAEVTAAAGALRTAQAALFGAESKLRLLGMPQAEAEAVAKGGQINPEYTVRAPIDGRVIEREVTLGELVSPEKESLVVLADTSRLWVLADVPEAMVNAVAKDATARIRTVATTRPIVGMVTHVSPQMDTTTRTVRARVEVANADGQLRPGMFAHAEISAGDAEGAAVLCVPEDAVLTVEGGPAVFVPVAGEENTFAARPVKVGKPVGGMVPVTVGLNEGDAVVVAGAFILKADLGKSGAAHEH